MDSMKKGGQPTPPSLKILKGTFREDRHGAKESVGDEQVLQKVPAFPAGVNAVFKKWWTRYCTDLIGVGVLTQRDLAAVHMLCDAHAELEAVQQRLNEAGDSGLLYFITDAGTYARHPGISHSANLRKQIESYQHKLGMDPTSRIRVTPKVPVDKKKKVAGLNRRGV